MPDPYDLDRFVQAQEPVMAQVLAEMAAGRKRTHWMWFVFPQLAGLGHSAMARRYALGSLDEVRAYLAHPVLGPRLVQCAGLVNGVEGRTAHEIFGSPDNFKFHSCTTLFALAQPGEEVFRRALDKYFGGAMDPMTVERVAGP
jgi:uncharacterized protein (DUF1810 family)